MKNRFCQCGEDLVKARRSNRVRFWIDHHLPGGKQKRVLVGYSIDEAKASDGKRKSQKAEGRILDVIKDNKIRFEALAKWYLQLSTVTSLRSCWRIKIALRRFCEVFGSRLVSEMLPPDIEEYQQMRLKEGKARATIDQEVGAAKAVIYKAFQAKKLNFTVVSAFKEVHKLLSPGGNTRGFVLTKEQYDNLYSHLPDYLKPIVATAYYTGMRRGEILGLTWNRVDLKNRLITLRAEDTKTKQARIVPICSNLAEMLANLPSRIHSADTVNYLFGYKGKPVRKDIRGGLTSACEKSGIPYGRYKGMTFHDLRHTFNTNMRRSGVPEGVIMKMTGHRTRTMFDRYDHPNLDDAHKAVETMQSFLLSVDQMLTKTKKGKTTSKR